MPFVIPRISVPQDYNSSCATRQSEYGPDPTVEDLEKYESWLCEELALVREAVNLAKYEARVTETTTTELTEKNSAPHT